MIPNLPADAKRGNGRWILVAGVPGLLLWPLGWGFFSEHLPHMGDFFAGRQEYWLWFAGYLIAVQWSVFVCIVHCLHKAGVGLASVGLPVRWTRVQPVSLAVVALLLITGAALVAVSPLERTASTPVILPTTLTDRLVMILLLAPTAAVVEEVVFRGFALTYLPVVLGGRVWVTVIVAGLLFAAMHGDWDAPWPTTGAFNFGYRFAFALLFSALFLWRRYLKLPITLHWLVNGFSALTPYAGRLDYGALYGRGRE